MLYAFGVDESLFGDALEHAVGEGVDVGLEEGFQVAVAGGRAATG